MNIAALTQLATAFPKLDIGRLLALKSLLTKKYSEITNADVDSLISALGIDVAGVPPAALDAVRLVFQGTDGDTIADVLSKGDTIEKVVNHLKGPPQQVAVMAEQEPVTRCPNCGMWHLFRTRKEN